MELIPIVDKEIGREMKNSVDVQTWNPFGLNINKKEEQQGDDTNE